MSSHWLRSDIKISLSALRFGAPSFYHILSSLRSKINAAFINILICIYLIIIIIIFINIIIITVIIITNTIDIINIIEKYNYY